MRARWSYFPVCQQTKGCARGTTFLQTTGFLPQPSSFSHRGVQISLVGGADNIASPAPSPAAASGVSDFCLLFASLQRPTRYIRFVK